MRLPADAYRHLVHTLRLSLPPPPGANPGPEDLRQRDHAAIAGIAALAPANAAEAEIAAQFVAASEQWKHCLQLAEAPDATPQWAAKCRAQAISMTRQAQGALRLVLRMQEIRRKLEADTAARDRLAWMEHCAIGLMAEALSSAPNPASAAAIPNPQPAGTASAAPPADCQPGPKPDAGADETDLIAAAERYATAYPERAARIRRTGRLPSNVLYFDPPEASLGRALIGGRTPILEALDTLPLPDLAAPANASATRPDPARAT